ncbi:HIG1 domain family member 2A, mitochondrial [Galendromus occidentalis]|uniref:HIG1 domain family member 2A, mitochondrial n=1 Tax=Galendromus occidentalis TaxID=34638 RepID=A0AAJ6QTY1_9ACAR|nr:HIG1 domain family member 2A, mitochondrial [Galendromus occidentalis]XP_003743664.1 HIG1 domain family member 2A, mitochondrial [Galendromus occidentalis]
MPEVDPSYEELEWVTVKHLDEPRERFADAKRKFRENPFLPIGLLGTTLCLAFGLRAMMQGNRAQSQLMMRGRVLAQGATVAALVFGFVIKSQKDLKKMAATAEKKSE